MPIKKSALLFILLSVCSVSLLIVSSGITPAETVIPVKCTAASKGVQMDEPKIFSPLHMISHIMLRPAT